MPDSPSPGSTSSYVAQVISVLGDQDPIAIMRETPGWLAARIAGRADGQLGRPEAPGKWSVVQVIAHLADAEIAFAWRLRTILTQSEPELQAYDQDQWVDRFDYSSADVAEALAAFTNLRRWNLRAWSAVRPEDLPRVGRHSERGPESLDLMRRLMGGHDLIHRRQIDRILATTG